MSIRVSAVQLAFGFSATPQEFFDRVREPIERAALDGAQLVVLPDYTGLMLLGTVVPGADERFALEEIAKQYSDISVGRMLSQVAPALRDLYVHLFGSLASRLQVYLAPGTVIEPEDGSLYNTAYLFGPNGQVVGTQRQTHRTQEEIGWGLAQGQTLRVFDVDRARVGLVVGTDVAYPEVSRILALQRANVLIHPAAYPSWSDEHFLIDLWREVQANQVYGVQACAVGRYQGRSAVYGPVELEQARGGVLAQASNPDEDQVVTATLDMEALQRVIDGFPIFDFFNYEFYARDLPRVYREAAGEPGKTATRERG